MTCGYAGATQIHRSFYINDERTVIRGGDVSMTVGYVQLENSSNVGSKAGHNVREASGISKIKKDGGGRF